MKIEAKSSNNGIDVFELINKSKIESRIYQIRTIDIKPDPNQPRTYFDEEKISELAISIKENGLIQPIIVAKEENGKYTIIAGERRYRAVCLLGLETIDCIVKLKNKSEKAVLSILENIQREDLNVIEVARGYRRLIEEFGFSHESLAKKLGRGRSTISNTLRLLELNKKVQAKLLNGNIDMGHARALLPLPVIEQEEITAKIINEQLTVRQTEKLVNRHLQRVANHKQSVSANSSIEKKWKTLYQDNDWLSFQFSKTKAGQGKLILNFSDEKELQYYLEQLKPNSLKLPE